MRSFMLFDWCGKCFHYRPFVAMKSCAEGLRDETKLLRPLLERLGFPRKGDVAPISTVTHLLFVCSPSAIFLTIIASVINSVNRCVLLSMQFHMRFIRIPHVFVEFVKRFPKALNSPPTVLVKGAVVRVCASVLCTIKNLIETCFTMPWLRTPAGFRVPHYEHVSANNFFHPTDANTQPKRATVFVHLHKFFHGQLAKLLPHHVFYHTISPLKARRIGWSVPSVAPMLITLLSYTYPHTLSSTNKGAIFNGKI